MNEARRNDATLLVRGCARRKMAQWLRNGVRYRWCARRERSR